MLPFDVPANEFLNLEGRQLSTSRNWAVWVPDYLDRFPPDPLRYHLTANLPETGDADFTWAEYVRRNNDELVATFGNLVHRVLTQVYRNFDGCIPDPGKLGEDDKVLMSSADQAFVTVAKSIEAVRLREGLVGAMSLARETNRYLDAQAPWQKVKTDKPAAARSLFTATYCLMALRVLMYPYVPFSAQRLHQLLGQNGAVEEIGWNSVAPEPGCSIPEPKPLFTKLDDSIAEEMLGQLG